MPWERRQLFNESSARSKGSSLAFTICPSQIFAKYILRAQSTDSVFIDASTGIVTRKRSPLQRLIQVADQIVGRLEADRQAYDVIAGPRCFALLVGKLPMRGRGRMQDQASRIADIRQMREQAHALDQPDTGLEPTFDAKSENGARAFRQILLRELVIGAVLEARVGHPGDLWVLAQKFGDLPRVLDMPPHPHMQRLDAGDGEECVHRRKRRTEIAQGHRTGLHGEGEIAEILEELEPVIRGLRLG